MNFSGSLIINVMRVQLKIEQQPSFNETSILERKHGVNGLNKMKYLGKSPVVSLSFCVKNCVVLGKYSIN